VVILYEDVLGRRESLIFDSTGNQTVERLTAECEQRMPSDAENPAKTEVQQEIQELEYRLRMLKESIGQA
jgi:hypothetical protein